jgi:hypothetical protein
MHLSRNFQSVLDAFFVDLTSLLFHVLLLSIINLLHMQEDIIAKLIDFLVAPQVTTSVSLAEQEKVYYTSLSFQLFPLT